MVVLEFKFNCRVIVYSGNFLRHFSVCSVCATMKLTITTVKVCSTELNDSRSKESVTDVCREAPPESTTEVRISQPQ